MPQSIAIRITRRPDGRFVTRSPNPKDGPLGVDTNVNQAIGTAVREATRLSRDLRCRIVIEVEQADGKFRVEQIVNRPVSVARKPGPKSN